jgi:hypothetical protein
LSKDEDPKKIEPLPADDTIENAELENEVSLVLEIRSDRKLEQEVLRYLRKGRRRFDVLRGDVR